MNRPVGWFLALVAVGWYITPGGTQPAAEKFPPELVRFEPCGKTPVFWGRGKGFWDLRLRERGWILKEGDTYKMWYTGYDGTQDGIRRLGYATSTDGIDWKRHDKNPLLPDLWVEDMMVVRQGGKYHMFAEGRDVIVEGVYEGNDRFVARTILTSCPSKYEPEVPAS